MPPAFAPAQRMTELPPGWPVTVQGLSDPERMEALELHAQRTAEVIDSLEGLRDAMKTANRLFKFWAPIITTAAIASGMVGGKGALFLKSVLHSLNIM